MLALIPTWLLLGVAILVEVVSTSSIKLPEGFTRPLMTLLVLCGYGCSLWLLSQVVQRLEVGIVYAIWCGVGMAAVALVGVLVFGESVSLAKTAGIVLIVAGTILLSLASKGQ